MRTLTSFQTSFDDKHFCTLLAAGYAHQGQRNFIRFSGALSNSGSVILSAVGSSSTARRYYEQEIGAPPSKHVAWGLQQKVCDYTCSSRHGYTAKTDLSPCVEPVSECMRSCPQILGGHVPLCPGGSAAFAHYYSTFVLFLSWWIRVYRGSIMVGCSENINNFPDHFQ